MAIPLSEKRAPLSARERELTHTSLLLRGLIDEATDEHFTLDWLIGHLPKHSFGVIMLFLALLSLLPVISIPARILMMVLALQIIMGFPSPVLPKSWRTRQFPSRYLARLDRHAIPALEWLEKIAQPRWEFFLFGIRRVTACIALMLTMLSLLVPLPLSNVPPALVSALIALSYIEHDGLLLLIGLVMAVGMLAAVCVLTIATY